MQLLEMVDGVDEEQLPQVYSPDGIQLYWGRRPVAVCRRITQLLSEFGWWTRWCRTVGVQGKGLVGC